MGMFDRVKVVDLNILPLSEKEQKKVFQSCKGLFQTKSLYNSMSNYFITPRKELWVTVSSLEFLPRYKRSNPKVTKGIQALFGSMQTNEKYSELVPFTGVVNFYDYPSDDKMKRYYKHTYGIDCLEVYAHFKKGKLKKVFKTKDGYCRMTIYKMIGRKTVNNVIASYLYNNDPHKIKDYEQVTSWYRWYNKGGWKYNHSSNGWLFDHKKPTDLHKDHDELVKRSEWKKMYTLKKDSSRIIINTRMTIPTIFDCTTVFFNNLFEPTKRKPVKRLLGFRKEFFRLRISLKLHVIEKPKKSFKPNKFIIKLFWINHNFLLKRCYKTGSIWKAYGFSRHKLHHTWSENSVYPEPFGGKERPLFLEPLVKLNNYWCLKYKF